MLMGTAIQVNRTLGEWPPRHATCFVWKFLLLISFKDIPTGEQDNAAMNVWGRGMY